MESLAQIMNQIDQLQQQGYLLIEKDRLSEACKVWKKAWELAFNLLQSGRYSSVENLDLAYHGKQSISNWAADYGEALRKAGSQDLTVMKDSSEFFRQYLSFSSQTDLLNNRNRRRLLAENYYKSGSPEAGDALFAQYLRENPRWGWGWVSWASQYSFYKLAPWHDLKRAEAILRQALQVADLDDRTVVLEQLRDVLVKQGRTIEAATIEVGGKRRWKAKFW